MPQAEGGCYRSMQPPPAARPIHEPIRELKSPPSPEWPTESGDRPIQSLPTEGG